MKRIGITGGIGAGKSLVCHIFEQLGIPNYPADARAKWLQAHNPQLKAQIINLLGTQAYSKSGTLNRAFISQTVFSDKRALEALNSLVHPAVQSDFEEWCMQHKDKSFILKEAALLFETASYQQLDATILVHSNKAVRLQRTLARDPQRTADDVESIMKQQMPDEEKIKLANFVIYNDESQSLIKQCVKLYQHLKK